MNKMKRLLVILSLVLLGFSSCVNNAKGKTNKNEAILHEINYNQPLAVKFSFEGHKYIMFYYSRSSSSIGGVIDDPNCELCKKE